jgi:branched-chain amino acid transport system ATP-binding protein
MRMIEFDGVDVYYAKNHVLKGISLAVEAGKVVSLIGANAAGKTTTLRTALGLKAQSAGKLRFDGADITHLPTVERVRRGLVLVPEGRQVFVKFTVAENLMMGGYLRPDRDRMRPDLDRAYEMFPRLAERRNQRAGSMSGGEQQMLAIARGLMSKPRCLVLDEPSLGLAPILVEEIARTVRQLAAEGMTVLLAEQNAAMALGCASRAFVLESGRVVLEGEAREIERSETVRKLYLGH